MGQGPLIGRKDIASGSPKAELVDQPFVVTRFGVDCEKKSEPSTETKVKSIYQSGNPFV